jgi:hypothetical protein
MAAAHDTSSRAVPSICASRSRMIVESEADEALPERASSMANRGLPPLRSTTRLISAARHRSGQGPGLVGAQRSKVDAGDPLFPLELLKEARSMRVVVDLAAAGGYDEARRPCRPGYVVNERRAGLVDPLQIVDGHERYP